MRITELLNADNTLVCNRYLSHALGATEALIYTSLVAKQIYYASRSMLNSKGMFYSTERDLAKSTGFSKSQQQRAIKVLVNAGLIVCERGGMPAKRCFLVKDDTELLETILAAGRKVENRLTGNMPTGCTEMIQPVDIKTDSKSAENQSAIYNHKKENKDNNHKISIISDGVGAIDERNKYLDIIKANIEYDCIPEKDKPQVDELVEIMVDVICPGGEYVRVNGQEVSAEVVKSRFLKISSSHIEYVLLALKENTSEIRNIRSYMITALYNAPTTMDNYFQQRVNHDLYGAKR